MVASKGSALMVAAVLQLLLLASNAVPCAGQDPSLQQCVQLDYMEARTLSYVALGLDYLPYELTDVTTCVNLGLTCSDSGYVTYINWQNKGIQGELPPDIFQLKHLDSLYMDRNKFSGTLPDAIGNMVSLTELVLMYNDFTGPLPSSMGRLTNLYNLDLSHNHLSGTLPQSFSTMASLSTISLNSNLFSGSLSPLAALSSLMGM
ncbi:unnamed protein product [Closterium sp. Yama58-4]|nr:unnamed protein product [Closterium sp. Yama58-4]